MVTPSRMNLHSRLSFSLLVGLLVLPSGVALAMSGDLEMKTENFTLSDTTVVHGQTVRLYATVNNNSGTDLLGSVQFKNSNGTPIGSDQPVSVLKNGTDTVFVDWTATAGTHTLTATVVPWDKTKDNPENNSTPKAVTADYDFDNDGVGNAQDPDDDNDEVQDAKDAFPLDKEESTDTDEDGTGNNTDEDDDNDSTPDVTDQLPDNPTEVVDTDGDGTGNNADEDDDNDGLTDIVETNTTTTPSSSTTTTAPTTDPLNPDTDGDTHLDGADIFPVDPEEWVDTDSDGIGNNTDTDDENDGLPDKKDPFPLNKGPEIVLEEYEETGPATPEFPQGTRIRIMNASKSYDPEGEEVVFRWFSKDGRLIGEEAILKLQIGTNTLFPTQLSVTDKTGEERIKKLKLTAVKYWKAMGASLGISLLLVLAILTALRYFSHAPKKKSRKK